MKLASSIILPALCWTTRLTAAESARVYIHDPQLAPRPDAEGRSLQPVPARLVLAQRVGVEDYHSSDLSREEVVDAINEYGIRAPLFTAADSSLRKATILLEGQDHIETLFDSYTSFDIAPVSASRGLFMDLAKQSDPSSFAHLSDDALADLFKESRTTTKNGDLFYIAQTSADLKEIFVHLSRTKKWTITALVTSPIDASPSQVDNTQWGAYEVPGTEAPLRTRQRRDEGWSIYQHGTEETLTETRPASAVQSFTAPVAVFADNKTPLKGILPACFASQGDCVRATRNCTGHGSCSKRYYDKSPHQDKYCYSCECALPKGKGTKWAGPACQKKDVSIEFWLITLFTVGMIFLIGFAVGTVWEMGQQELPSVIGAGVSGPTARK